MRYLVRQGHHRTPCLLRTGAGRYPQAMSLIVQIPVETLRQAGTLPWYGMDYSLDDVLVYMYYGHKREHSAQIAAFRDRLG